MGWGIPWWPHASTATRAPTHPPHTTPYRRRALLNWTKSGHTPHGLLIRPKNHTRSLPAASKMLRLRAKNRAVPAYPGVRLSPATLEMLASRPSMKPHTEVAAHLLSPEHASDDASWPRQPTRGVVTFQVCGGLTNQRLALLDGLMVAALLNFTAIAPQLNANGLQSGATYGDPMKKLVDFDTFFDGPATARALRGVPELPSHG